MIGHRDVSLKPNRVKELLLDKHEKYLKHYSNDDGGTEQMMAEYLKMSGMYWGLNALYIMDKLDDKSNEVNKALDFIKQCQNSDGGFAAALRHDSHILHTLSAIQVLVIFDKCNQEYLNIDKCVGYIKSLQQPDGSFFGDKWGEVDTRFSFCALATLTLLNRMDAINVDKAADFVMSCNNQIDGGFGSKPGSESHAAYVYCCVGSLALTNRLHLIDSDQLGCWLSERQLPSGGLNGRPEKLPDLCYSWWCLSSMKMINRIHLIDHKRLTDFILACQDDEQGGFSDRPGNWVDPYHTMFGIASLSLICYHFNSGKGEPVDGDSKHADESNNLTEEFQKLLDELRNKLKPVNPILCMPDERLEQINLNK